MDSSAADAVIPGDGSQAVSMMSVSHDRIAIEIESWPADVTAFEPRTSHAGAHTFDDQVTFEFGDRSDDDHDGPAQWAACVDLLAEADELDAEAVEFVQHFEEVPGRAGDAIACPDQDHIEAAAAGIVHELIESGPAGLHTGYFVGVLVDDLVSALGGHLAQIVQLGRPALRITVRAISTVFISLVVRMAGISVLE
jgi:hypothetical protein